MAAANGEAWSHVLLLQMEFLASTKQRRPPIWGNGAAEGLRLNRLLARGFLGLFHLGEHLIQIVALERAFVLAGLILCECLLLGGYSQAKSPVLGCRNQANLQRQKGLTVVVVWKMSAYGT